MAIDYYRSTATALFGGPVAGEPDGIPIIDPNTPEGRDLLAPKVFGRGYDPAQYVPDMMAAPDQMSLIPASEYDARYDEQESTQSSLEHIYLRDWKGPCLDQNGQGYCWSYSSHSAVMLSRLKMGMPFARLNPHAIASLVKGGRDEGGWCGLSLSKIREVGAATEGDGPTDWPVHGYGRQLNQRWADAAFKVAAARFVVTDDFYDLGKPVYAQSLKEAQRITCAFSLNPLPTDRMAWAHSTCDLRYVRIAAGDWGWLTLNSWLGWGRRGLAVIRPSEMKADGSVAVVATMAA